MKYDSRRLLLAVDIAGTFLFGIEGADTAIRGNLDLLGLMVLAFATALAGGVVRDLLIGAVPPERSATGATQPRPSPLRSLRFSSISSSKLFLRA